MIKPTKQGQANLITCAKAFSDPEEVKLFLESIDNNIKLGDQVWRANHGGGMPVPHSLINTLLSYLLRFISKS